MNHLITTILKISQGSSRNDDDIIDRLSHRHTVLCLVIFTIVITTTQYVGTPIHCWCPATYTDNHEKYANNLCWISNTYNLPPGVKPGDQGATRRYITYYQWVPVALLIQAVLFHLPCLFWRVFSDRSGINVNNLVEAAETIQNALYPERREKTIRYMIRHLDHYLDYQRDYRGGCCDGIKQCLHRKFRYLVCGNRRGNYLVALYMFTKILYISNAIAQLFLLDSFLGGEFKLFGIHAVTDIVTGSEWRGMERFPRLSYCDFYITIMGNAQKHTVQCVLQMNFFTEKIYLFLWFWLAFIGLITAFSFLRWLWMLGFEHSRTRYVRKHLKIMDRVRSGSDRDRKLAHKFAERYLRQDGIFVLKLVAKNSTDLVVADILAALWDNYRSKPFSVPIINVDRDLEQIEGLDT